MEQIESTWHPETEEEKELIRAQVRNLLRDPLFRSSKRYTGLLGFVVEQVLVGDLDCLKERYLGVEVFHRPADYDTSLDPVVRLSAAEVRKRIAQYYQQSEHHAELRIHLNPGSYIPVFYHPPNSLVAALPHAEEQETPATAPHSTFKRRNFWIGAAIMLLAVVTAIGVLRHEGSPARAADRFWAPIVSAPGNVTLSVGRPVDTGLPIRIDPPPSTVYDRLLHVQGIGTSGVITLMHIGAALETRHKPFRLLIATQTLYPQLREGPDILVGALNNPWTMRLTEQLRFGFAMDGGVAWIVDHKNPRLKNWQAHLDLPPSKFFTDYAIVARYQDPTLGQPVVIVAGISSEGTEALGEMLAKPEMMRDLFTHIPGNSNSENIEAVIQTQVIDGRPGPPHIIAVECW